MTVRQTASKRSTTAAAAAIFLLAGWHAAPVLAASDLSTLCENSHEATLDVAEFELKARQVSHDIDASELADLASSDDGLMAQDHLLKPRVEATVREVFADSDKKSLVEDDGVTDLEESAIEELTGPRLTDGHAVTFKRQMYRQDI
jgi:hypothetical protein